MNLSVSDALGWTWNFYIWAKALIVPERDFLGDKPAFFVILRLLRRSIRPYPHVDRGNAEGQIDMARA
jgi:hypothetical protein